MTATGHGRLRLLPATEPAAPMRRPLPRIARAPTHGFTPPPDRLVGRGDELAVLTTAFEDVVDGLERVLRVVETALRPEKGAELGLPGELHKAVFPSGV